MLKQIRHMGFTMLCDTMLSRQGYRYADVEAVSDAIGKQENSIPIQRPCCV